MASPVIPVHHLPEQATHTVRIERVRSAVRTVQNDVHRHDFHELFFFATGTGEHMIDLEPWPVQPPCIHVVSPGQVHQLTRSPDATGMVVMFGDTDRLPPAQAGVVGDLFGPGIGAPVFPITAAMLAEAQVLAGLIEQELERAEGPVDGIVLNYLGILLMKGVHWRRSGPAGDNVPPARTDPVQAFVRRVEAGFLHERQVAAYAQELAISAGHLNDLVRKRLGKSAGEVIQDRLLLEAKRLLLHADLSMKEVSYALHIEDPAYFNRLFKKATGLTPAEYRTQVREKYKR